MQYEGATVMNMFGKAKINVNLLLHFLNTKFYGRKRWTKSIILLLQLIFFFLIWILEY